MMGTHSYIGRERDDGSVQYVYCHWDGYPTHNGRILLEHYSSRERVEQLLALGELSSLAPRLEPTQPVLPGGWVGKTEEGVVAAYARERGDEPRPPLTAASLADLRAGVQYGYVLLRDGTWVYSRSHFPPPPRPGHKRVRGPVWRPWVPLDAEAIEAEYAAAAAIDASFGQREV